MGTGHLRGRSDRSRGRRSGGCLSRDGHKPPREEPDDVHRVHAHDRGPRDRTVQHVRRARPARGLQGGWEALVITVVSSDASTALLSGVVSLTEGGRSGELAVTGEIDARASSGVVAVTGGTGSFRGAKGEIAYSGAGLTSTVTTLTAHLTVCR